MNKYIKTLFIGASVIGLTACNDFLDEQPESSLTPQNYFKEASLLQAYVQDLYLWLPSHSDAGYELGTFSTDNGTDNQVGQDEPSRFTPGLWLVPDEQSAWNFDHIRKINYFFDYAQPNYESGSIVGSKSVIDQTMGEAHFFRAWAFWERYTTFGDFPIFTEALPDNKTELLEKSVRQPRNLVARFILDELTEAIALLPESSSKGKNGLNRACAQLFRSRVALFEGTWLKYHKGTALVPGGPGWPGDASLLGEGFNIDDEIAYFLTEAMNSAKAVGDVYMSKLVQNTVSDTSDPTNHYAGQDDKYMSLNPYYTMFCDNDLSAYDEVLLYRSYSVAQNVTTQIQAQFQKDAGGSGWTRGLVNSFLMKNGLPIYDSNSGYNPAWENDGVSASLKNRDPRVVIFTKGDYTIDTYSLVNGTPTIYRMGWMLDGGNRTACTTGYAIKKGKGYNYAEAQGNNASYTASITFRAVEAMLNYMEACVEKTGAVDGTADSYWKAIRNRAHIDPDYTKTVGATVMTKEAEYDLGAYSHGALLTNITLYNVRRERRNELAGEAQRMNDLRRWAALDQLATTPYIVEGIKYWGTCYADQTNPLCLKDDQGRFLAPVVGLSNPVSTMSPQSQGDYFRPYQKTTEANNLFNGYKFTRAHYLSPIGKNNFTNASLDGNIETSVLYQNPGWSTNTGTAASDLD